MPCIVNELRAFIFGVRQSKKSWLLPLTAVRP
jgi:hypothetical protein